MSPDAPAVPPEAEVIRLAREAMDMTAQSAAEASRAHGGRGVSAAYWRDVERGYGGRRGQRVPVRASDRALAAMARVVGVTPAQLTGAGREDAARVLDEILRRERPATLPQQSPTPAPGLPRLSPEQEKAARPHIDAINSRLAEVAEAQGLPLDQLTGAMVFDSLADQLNWDQFRGFGYPPAHAVVYLAIMKGDEDSRARNHGRGSAAGLIAPRGHIAVTTREKLLSGMR